MSSSLRRWASQSYSHYEYKTDLVTLHLPTRTSNIVSFIYYNHAPFTRQHAFSKPRQHVERCYDNLWQFHVLCQVVLSTKNCSNDHVRFFSPSRTKHHILFQVRCLHRDSAFKRFDEWNIVVSAIVFNSQRTKILYQSFQQAVLAGVHVYMLVIGSIKEMLQSGSVCIFKN